MDGRASVGVGGQPLLAGDEPTAILVRKMPMQDRAGRSAVMDDLLGVFFVFFGFICARAATTPDLFDEVRGVTDMAKFGSSGAPTVSNSPSLFYQTKGSMR